MTQFQSWLWPDHTIGKRESRQLREEQNALVNAYNEVLNVLRECITEDGAACWKSREYAEKRIRYISQIALSALTEAG